MQNPMDISNRVVLVTGASSGIGRATAVLLSQLGAQVVISGRDADRLASTSAQLAGTGHLVEPCDLRDSEKVPGWVKNVTAKTGPLSGMVHCAGVHSQRPLKILDSVKFEETQRINVTTAVMLAKGFRQKGCCVPGGAIVLLSSVAGLAGQAGASAYAASKAAVIGLTRSLALELAPERIRVNCVAPGLVRTEMGERLLRSFTSEQAETVERAHPLGIGEPGDVANAIAFLLSDASRWMTGSVLVVDGGYTAQ